MKRRYPFLLPLLAVFFAAWRFACGQASTAGALSGTVADSSGAVVPGATLTLSQTSTGFSRTTVTSADGAYNFPDLIAGQYVLTVKAGNPAVPGSQTNPEGLGSGGARDIQFRVQLEF